MEKNKKAGRAGLVPPAGCKPAGLPAIQVGVRFDSDLSPPVLKQVYSDIPSGSANISFKFIFKPGKRGEVSMSSSSQAAA